MKKMILAVAALFMLASCEPKENAPLETTNWKLVELYGDANPVFEAGDSFTFTLDGESITGIGSVNRFFGGYTLTEDGLKVGDNMGMTRMMGENIDLEDAYVQMFADVDGYAIDGDELSLTSAGVVVARFKVCPEVAPESAQPEAQTFGTPVISVDEARQMQAEQAEASEAAASEE